MDMLILSGSGHKVYKYCGSRSTVKKVEKAKGDWAMGNRSFIANDLSPIAILKNSSIQSC